LSLIVSNLPAGRQVTRIELVWLYILF